MSADVTGLRPSPIGARSSTEPDGGLRRAVAVRRRRQALRRLLIGAAAYTTALAAGRLLFPDGGGGAGPLWAGYGIALGWMWSRRGPRTSVRLAVIAACTLLFGIAVGEDWATTLTYSAVLVVSLAGATVVLARAGHIRALGIDRESSDGDSIGPLLSIPLGVTAGVAVGWAMAHLTGAWFPTHPSGFLHLWMRDVTAMLSIGVPIMLFERGVLTFSVPRPIGVPSLLTGTAGIAERFAFGAVTVALMAVMVWMTEPLLTLLLILPVWAGLRFSSAGAVLCSIGIGTAVTIAAMFELGMFGVMTSEPSRMIVAQGTMIVAVAFGLVLGLRQQEVRTLAIAQDLVHRRARASEANLRSMLRRLDDGVVIADLDGCIRTVNPRACEIVGRQESRLLGRLLTDVWLDGTPPRPAEQRGADLRARISRLIDRGRTISVETGIERGDGHVVTTMSHFVPLTGDDASHALAVVFTDLTEQRRYEHRLVTFARSVAHDIKGSIGAVGRWFEILDLTVENYDLPPEQRTRLQSLTDQGTVATRELSHLLNGLLTTTTERRPDAEVVDLAGCIRRQAWLLGLADAVDLEEIPPVVGHAPQLEQLFANLLANSARYARRGERPLIEIRTRPSADDPADRVVVAVRDHGIGIPDAELDAVFAAARRGSNVNIDPAAPPVEGHGLGLAICADIVRAHDGDIRAVAPADGGPGVCIEVVLPLAT